MPENYSWKQLIDKAYSLKLNLSAMYLALPPEGSDTILYDIDAAACSEVIIDVLTGETQVIRADILYDCGQRFFPFFYLKIWFIFNSMFSYALTIFKNSINGLIDLGQAEGGFVMGLGFILLERTVYDPKTGI